MTDFSDVIGITFYIMSIKYLDPKLLQVFLIRTQAYLSPRKTSMKAINYFCKKVPS